MNWIELTVTLPLAGGACVGLLRTSSAAYRWALGFAAAAFVASLVAAVRFYAGWAPGGDSHGVLPWLVGRPVLALDELSAPLVPAVALLHLLTVLATAGVKVSRFSFGWLLGGESVRLAMFACVEPWPLIALLIVGTVPPVVEMARRGRPVRVYAIHMALFAVLLIVGWALTEGELLAKPAWATVPLLLALLIRCGTVPAHAWVPDLFENASFGNSVLVLAPIAGVYAALRLVLPTAPDWVLQWIGLASLVTAAYSASMAVVQRDARRFFAYLFLSHSSLVLVGLELHTALSLTGALSLWLSVLASLGGLGLTLRALEARYGRLSLTAYRGLYGRSPTLAGCFLVMGLGAVGFPGTLGFVAMEMLVDGAVGANPFVGVAVAVTGALNGIAVLRAWFLLFTGSESAGTVPVGVTGRERFAVLVLATAVVGGGLVPQPWVHSRHEAAKDVLARREARLAPGLQGPVPPGSPRVNAEHGVP